jgi:riboflavin-specific deaminase-like protein
MDEAGTAGARVAVGVEAAWQLLLLLRRLADAGGGEPAPSASRRRGFALVEGCRWRPDRPEAGEIVVDAGAAAALVAARRPLDPAARELLELHLGHASRGPARPHAVAILGQSLDGFIATRDGHSRYINGEAVLIHLHRLRALSDAVVIGVGTALADAPRLTTRHVPGPDAVRVVIDPRGRLPENCGLLRDGAGPTLVVRAGAGGERPLSAQATALHLPAGAGGDIDPERVLAALADRGLTRVLVEGGGGIRGRGALLAQRSPGSRRRRPRTPSPP